MKNLTLLFLIIFFSCDSNKPESQSSKELVSDRSEQEEGQKDIDSSHIQKLGVWKGVQMNKQQVDSTYSQFSQRSERWSLTSDDLFTIKQILYYHDVENQIGTSCNGYTNCKWCNNPIEYQGTIEGRSDDIGKFVVNFKLMDMIIKEPSTFDSTTIEEIRRSRFVTSLHDFLEDYRINKGLECVGNPPKFCSLKCRTEYKDRFGRDF